MEICEWKIPITLTLETLDIAPTTIASVRQKLWEYKADVDNFNIALI